MILHFIKVSLLAFKKERLTTIIIVSGFSIAVCLFALLRLYIKDELSYDQHNKRKNEVVITSLHTENKEGQIKKEWDLISPGYSAFLKNISGIKKTGKIYPWVEPTIQIGNNEFKETQFAFAEPNILELLDINIIDKRNNYPLNEPNSIILSRSISKKYFGAENAVGRIITYSENNRKLLLQVTAVMEDIPKTSHVHFNAFISFNTFLSLNPNLDEQQLSGNYNFITYALIERPHQSIEKDINQILIEKLPAEALSKQHFRMVLTPVANIHLSLNASQKIIDTGSKTNVIVFSIVLILFVIIVSMNYINMSLARYIKRLKEFGIRKVIGATNKNLLLQSLTETLVFVIISTFIGLILASLSLQWFNNFIEKEYAIFDLFSFEQLLYLLLLIIFILAIAGIYPSFVISRSTPAKLIKSQPIKLSLRNISLTSILLTLQFICSTSLLIIVFFISKQVQYATETMGFKKDNILIANTSSLSKSETLLLAERLKENRNIIQISSSSSVPGEDLSDAQEARLISGESTQNLNFRLPYVNADEHFSNIYGLTLIAGNNFSTSTTDTFPHFLVSAETLTQIGIKNPATIIGAQILYGKKIGKLVGVFEDFHYESFKKKIGPLLISNKKSYKYLSINYHSNGLQNVVNDLQKLFKQIKPSESLVFHLMNERLEQLYKKEKKLITMIHIFSLLTILLALSGVFSLIQFINNQKKKEMTIRKILGSSIANIIALLIKDFIKLILIGSIFALPLSKYILTKWIAEYSYTIKITWHTSFLIAASVCIIATLLLILSTSSFVYQRPVKNLKND